MKEQICSQETICNLHFSSGKTLKIVMYLIPLVIHSSFSGPFQTPVPEECRVAQINA